MKMSNWVGYAVSVSCGEPLGCYQGTILKADGATITLTKAFRNGFPYPKSQVTLNAADIKELKIIEARADASAPSNSTVAVKSKKGARATVCENLQANYSNTGNQSGGGGGSRSSGGGKGSGPPRSKPIDIQNQRNKNNTHAGSYGPSGAARRKNEACFGGSAEEFLDDFDFEKNLALFDKSALFEEMRNAQKPDLIRQTDAHYRHDQNILLGPGARALQVPAAVSAGLYRTGAGARVPALSRAARAALWAALLRGPGASSALLLLARAAADVALRLVGGSRRLEARNAHQAPVVLVCAGDGPLAPAALAAGRLLVAHGARVLAAAGAAGEEARLLVAAGGRVLAAGEAVPRAELALLAPGAAAPTTSLLLLETDTDPSGRARAAVFALLPPPPPAPAALHLANVAPPLSIFSDIGVTYTSPFGASSVIQLHPDDDS